MRRHSLAVGMLIIALSIAPYSSHAENRTKENAIRELLELTGTEALVDQQIHFSSKLLWSNLSRLLRKAYPTAPEKLYTMIEKESVAAFMETKPEFLSGAVSIYSKHFTIGEIEEMIAFYRTPLGQKVIRTMPKLLGELTAFGAIWGRDVGRIAGERVKDKLRKRGYEL